MWRENKNVQAAVSVLTNGNYITTKTEFVLKTIHRREMSTMILDSVCLCKKKRFKFLVASSEN